MYLCETKLGVPTSLVLIKNGQGVTHTLVYIGETGKFYDVFSCYISASIKTGWYKIWDCPYNKIIWMTYYYHDNVGEYH